MGKQYLWGAADEYTPEGELVSYSVPDGNIDGIKHIYDANDNLIALSVDDSADFSIEDYIEDENFSEETFDSISLEDFV